MAVDDEMWFSIQSENVARRSVDYKGELHDWLIGKSSADVFTQ